MVGRSVSDRRASTREVGRSVPGRRRPGPPARAINGWTVRLGPSGQHTRGRAARPGPPAPGWPERAINTEGLSI